MSKHQDRDSDTLYSRKNQKGATHSADVPLTHNQQHKNAPFTWEQVRRKGVAFCLEEQWENALPWLDAAYFHYPEMPDTTFLLALAQTRLGLKNESISTAKTLEDAGPYCIKTRLRLCWLNVEIENMSKCISHLNAASRLRIQSSHLWPLQLKIYLQQHQYKAALAFCKETEKPSFPNKELVNEIIEHITSKEYEHAGTKLFELFLLLLKSISQLDVQHPHQSPTSIFHHSFSEEGLIDLPPKRKGTIQHQHPLQLKNQHHLQQLRFDTEVRKRFWIKERIRFRESNHPKLLESFPSSESLTQNVPIITIPPSSKPKQHTSFLTFLKPSVGQTLHPKSEPFQSYTWLMVRQPWDDERLRLQQFVSSSLLPHTGKAFLWVLTTSHPERMVGYGGVTATSKKQGILVVSVSPLIAFHRQETKLFITLIQQAKEMGLTRLNARVKKGSLEDSIIRRNGFRIVREEETWEHALLHLNRQFPKPSSKNKSNPVLFARRFMEKDWHQILELIQISHLNNGAEGVSWEFPDDTTMLPSLFSSQLSSVVELNKKIVGILLAKDISNKNLHILLKSTGYASSIPARSIAAHLLDRFVPLAMKQGYTTVRFKKHIRTNDFSDAKSKKQKRKGILIHKTRIFSREEITL